MKIADFISKSIQEYPLLYKDTDYEKSKLKVLDHVFFTIGNGMELAQTENPQEGGYVVTPKGKKDNKEGWIRLNDKPYGKEKYKPIPDGYFESVVYYVSAVKKPLETLYKKNNYGDTVLFRFDKKVENEFEMPKLFKAECFHPFSPYPFSKGCSIACDVFYDNAFLQEDWMRELIFLCKRTLEYFQNETQYINNSYWPTEKSIVYDLNYFNERFKDEGVKGVISLRKTWGCKVKDSVPDYEEIKQRKSESWEKFHKKQLSFLTDFLNKYDNPTE